MEYGFENVGRRGEGEREKRNGIPEEVEGERIGREGGEKHTGGKKTVKKTIRTHL